ncbi:MAG: sensor histidine kinase [Solirubrobacteraceae bacterium]
MTGSGPIPRHEEWLERWERRELPFLRVLPYVLLVLCVGFDLATRGGVDAGLAIDAGIAAIAGLAMAAVDRLDQRQHLTEARVAIGAAAAVGVFALLVATSAALVISEPLYGFYAWTGYLWAWRLLDGRARVAGVAAVAATVAVSQTGAGPYDSSYQIGGLIAVYLINVAVAGALTWFGWVGDERHESRGRHLSALREANAKLERSLRKNAQLQEQLLAQARETGVAEERRRLAREIHDTLAQGLTGVVTQLQAAQRTIDAQATGARHVQAAIGLARESLIEARRSLQALAPAPLVGARLPDAIADVAEGWSELQGTPVAVTTTGAARAIAPELEVALLRTAQEALANVAKHAHAGRVGLTLSYMEDLVTLDVRDNGVGFATVNGSGPRRPRETQGGFGLAAMRQRVEGVGGTLAIESEPGAGTAICATVAVTATAGRER